MRLVALFDSTSNGPLQPCAIPQTGALAFSAASEAQNPYTGEAVVGVVALAALLALIVTTCVLRRGGWATITLGVLSGLVGLMMAGWLAQVALTYSGGGCVLTLDPAPFDYGEVDGVAALFVVVLVALALAWLVMTILAARARARSRAAVAAR